MLMQALKSSQEADKGQNTDDATAAAVAARRRDVGKKLKLTEY